MPEVIQLKGIAWDHPRGYEPLRATSTTFAEDNPDISISWDIRSLKEFGDMPIEDLIDTYDLITIDHPYMGQAYANKLLLPLEELLGKNKLTTLEKQSVGPSFNTYFFNNHLYALPIDAAALVAAYRKDLVSTLNISIPKSRADLISFYKKIPSKHAVAWPLCPTDLWCTFLTLCAQDSNGIFMKEGRIDEKIGTDVLDELKQHLKYLHPESINWNPIQVLDYMAADNHLLYSPFLFGYTNYARTGYANEIVNFTNSPVNPVHTISTILGGVGLAVSAKSSHPKQAVDYLDYVASADIQAGVFTNSGGQPGNLVAWQSKAANDLCNNFFKNTLQTMENVYVRPQHKGWNHFQEQGADILHDGLVNNDQSSHLIKKLNELYQSIH